MLHIFQKLHISTFWLICVCCVAVFHVIRAAVVLLNIPLIIIGTRGYAVLSLFLVANLLTVCGLVPIICGLITPLRGFITETGVYSERN